MEGGKASAEARRGSAVQSFPCMYCSRRFLSSQALGGHQNAHKKERAAAQDAAAAASAASSSSSSMRRRFLPLTQPAAPWYIPPPTLSPAAPILPQVPQGYIYYYAPQSPPPPPHSPFAPPTAPAAAANDEDIEIDLTLRL